MQSIIYLFSVNSWMYGSIYADIVYLFTLYTYVVILFYMCISYSWFVRLFDRRNGLLCVQFLIGFGYCKNLVCHSFLHSWQVGRPETISKGPKPVGLLCLFICVALIQVLDHDVITIEPVRQLPVLVSYFRLLMPCTKKNVLSIYGAAGMTCYDII